ncbi:uncharacterized protein [Amphiura filiformis]|uniref:uncharacterized protein n=1 Tax=Amphiura filiformis TaxID=82378 RepID=UPI003B215511
MANHKAGTESYASSSVGLRPMNVNSNQTHSQTWTLVNEFYMGGRQQRILDPHECWKYDLQCQIAAMEDKVRDSQDEFPGTKEDSTGIGRKHKDSMAEVHNDFEKQRLEFAKRQAGRHGQNITNSLAGLGRNEQGKKTQQKIHSKLPNVISNATEAHLGLMDTTLHGAVLGPNTGRTFNTGDKR